MEKLCDDIISKILIQLPSKDIVQSRCVCKRWNTLLREANFIKSHLRRSINNNSKDEILLVFNRGSPFKAYSTVSPDIELVNFIKFPVDFPTRKITVLDSANGLICFSVGFDDDSVIHVWNPSLSTLLTVPYATPVRSHPKVWYSFRFGFDPKNDDYKIVKLRMVRHKQSVEWLQVEVYSMRSGCWKLITQRFPSRAKYNFNHRKIHVCADGYLHWLCGSYDDLRDIQSIVAFDLAAESFNEISLPHPMTVVDYHSGQGFYLGVFGKKLCVISCARGVGDCKVWVMDQYGSWVKNGFSHFHKGGIYPFGFTSKNNFLYEDCKNVIHLYDPSAPFNKVKSFQKIMDKCYAFSDDTIIIPYVESLVWVTPPTC